MTTTNDDLVDFVRGDLDATPRKLGAVIGEARSATLSGPSYLFV